MKSRFIKTAKSTKCTETEATKAISLSVLPNRRDAIFSAISLSSILIIQSASASIPLTLKSNEHASAMAEIGGRMSRPRTSQRQPRQQQSPPSPESDPAEIKQAIDLYQKARQASRDADYQLAYDYYNTLITKYPGLALSERARVARAILLYQISIDNNNNASSKKQQISMAIAQLEDEEVSLSGSAEVSAALAAMLWTERPGQRERAESLWEASQEFDKRFSDVEWVAREKLWPPRLVDALKKFLSMS
jgi:tetratricopeptide (TPR) repeat protein